MNNRKLGGILIGVSFVIIVLLFIIRAVLVDTYQAEAAINIEQIGSCHADGGTCPHERLQSAQAPIFIAGALLVGVMSLGIYLIFFERSQKEIVSALRKQKRERLKEDKFNILLKGMNPDERKVMKAVKEQEGITQQTLRLRTDMHKSKLSIVLDGLEKKGLVKRVAKGKTKQVYLKISL